MEIVMMVVSAASHPSACIQWAACGRPIRGEVESGDQHIVVVLPQGALVAAIDGLGHGAEAAHAATIASHALAAEAHEPVIHLMRRCHEALRKTRGAAISMASFDAIENTMTWMGVGNVEGVLARADGAPTRARETLISRAGVVGYQMPPLRAETLTVAPQDVLILVTDGIDTRFQTKLSADSDPEHLAADILDHHGKATDDALVLAARYLGAPQ